MTRRAMLRWVAPKAADEQGTNAPLPPHVTA